LCHKHEPLSSVLGTKKIKKEERREGRGEREKEKRIFEKKGKK
jgi:hypothetical protein